MQNIQKRRVDGMTFFRSEIAEEKIDLGKRAGQVLAPVMVCQVQLLTGVQMSEAQVPRCPFCR